MIKILKLVLFFLIIAFPVILFGQETFSVMQYNLLGYSSSGYITCDDNNNNIDDKDNYIKTIFQYVKPDIFTVNEISSNSTDHTRLLTNCINTNGISNYKRATLTNYSNSIIVNQLFYNSSKFSLYSQDVISSGVRDINVYKLKYYKNDIDNKSIFLYCIVAHLKAGTYDSDKNDRADMTSNIMSFLANLNSAENVLIMGDFNLYTSNETAYQNMVNPSDDAIKMHDPIEMEGNWSSNSYYSSVHTQSTHTYNNSCAATGGLDDRFDFILASNSIMHNTKKIAYVMDSYKVVGQDGQHYNDALTDSPTNSSVPSDVLNALYNNSDHLPVTLTLKINTTTGIDDLQEISGINIQYTNPCSNELKINISNSKSYQGKLSFELYSVLGQKLLSDVFELNAKNFFVDVSNLSSGTYFLHFSDENNNHITKKLIKK